MRAKDIHMAIKTDNPAEELMRKFEISTQEQLFDSIRRVVPQGYQNIIRQIEKKSKRFKKRSNCKISEAVLVCENQDEDCNASEVVDANSRCYVDEEDVTMFDVFEDFDEVEECDDMQSTDAKEKELEQLQNDERNLSDMVCELEREHADIVALRGKILGQLEDSDKALRKLRQALCEEQKKATELCREYDALENRMQEVTRECSAQKELLSDLRVRITELQKISIFMYQDGTIEVENGDMIEVPDAEVHTIFGMLYKLPEAGDVMIKELMTVAKLMHMKDEYERMGRKYEIYFDNLKVQILWEAAIRS